MNPVKTSKCCECSMSRIGPRRTPAPDTRGRLQLQCPDARRGALRPQAGGIPPFRPVIRTGKHRWPGSTRQVRKRRPVAITRQSRERPSPAPRGSCTELELSE
ncbi:hypothetical protein ATSB10_23290 [Dyella thiooxydans]|uniref:Uncharacterized protein n=1 Tax=Dyella thiooxydans TaxID=445710 RepID=A0A160N1R3_9GAMM|nr:hypothetical protein ATSB10_23290 [Dyella thiooxydans]